MKSLHSQLERKDAGAQIAAGKESAEAARVPQDESLSLEEPGEARPADGEDPSSDGSSSSGDGEGSTKAQ